MHRDLDIEFPEYDEPAHVPTGEECEHSARGENCGLTDCQDCGTRAALVLRDNARLGGGYVLTLAREVNRIVNVHGVNIPDGAVSRGDLARVYAARNGNRWDALDMPAYAWADAVCEALSGPVRFSHIYDTADENLAQAAGVQFVESWQAEQRRLRAKAKAMADAGITSAAVAQLAEQPRSPQGVVTGRSGFESRAQHTTAVPSVISARRR